MAGSIQNREAFLEKVASSLGRDSVLKQVEPPKYQYQPQHKVYAEATTEDLITIFKEHCQKIHSDYYQTSTDLLEETLRTAMEAFGGGPVMISKDDRFKEYGVDQLLKDAYEWNPEIGDENIVIAEKMQVGITFSEITLAESATVVLFSSPEKGRSVSLLPNTYIAIIPKSSIVPRMTQASQQIRALVQKGEAVPSSINYVTGPSNSADIEMNLVVGVHGPVKAAYIVVEDK